MQLRPVLLLPALALLAACASPARFSDLVGTGPDPDMMAAPAPAPEPLPEVRLIAAMEANGCVLNATNRNAIQIAANLTADELRTIVPRLADAGRLQVAGEGTIRALTQTCAATTAA
ncbi:hypothetical protein [Wenxinia saemankumensis]|uniref:Uncharacterized protein n=1 Tax=Wenxinia saemankumensis TaxID=1447782 RepID=A0A1M6HEJ1_9RHOB|nr:hypothetical protein [Wenxinia saemankumensis]SHJ20628.1 hypothetical protein SAMN05444417_3192 [Wenxinia saemankumensis]